VVALEHISKLDHKEAEVVIAKMLGHMMCPAPLVLLILASFQSCQGMRSARLPLAAARAGRAVHPLSTQHEFTWAEVDRAIDQVVATQTQRPIILGSRYRSSLGTMRLYTIWKDTVVRLTWLPMVCNTLFAALIVMIIRANTGAANPAATWPLFTAPDAAHPVVRRLAPFYTVWTHHVQLTTFILTFFLTESFGYWKRALCQGRRIQRAVVSILLLLSTHCTREEAAQGQPRTAEAQLLLEQTASELRLLHALFWARLDKSLSSLHSGLGLQRLAERGLISESQRAALGEIRPAHLHDAVLQWLSSRLVRKQGKHEHSCAAVSGYDFERRFDDQCLELRLHCHLLSTDRDGLMPFAYQHVVQVLVDSLLVFTAPALYPKIGVMSVGLTCTLTLFYRGLLELSKSFLDAFGQDQYQDQSIAIETYLSEVNQDLSAVVADGVLLPQLPESGAWHDV